MERDLTRQSNTLHSGISTHTLTWSVTGLSNFINHIIRISTHTLTWSVTETVNNQLSISLDFNSHAHVERDISIIYSPQHYLHFNSHAHVERDKKVDVLANSESDFNSHAHVERDL